VTPPVRLNIGGGGTEIPGFLNIDKKTGWDACPLRRSHERGESYFADNSVDEIYCSHLIEHFGVAEAERALREWVRVLKPGGIIRLATVDLMKVAGALADGNPDNLPILGYLYGGQTDEYDFHKSGYNDYWLERLMRECGLGDIRPWTAEYDDGAALDISLNLMGTKGAI
jgi:SAM-dependent methyltransferase